MPTLAQKKANPRSTYWLDKADREITRIYRAKQCLICGAHNPQPHHMICKSRCAYHRHTLENIIPLCSTHHTFGNDISAHSKSVLVVERFVEHIRTHHPEVYHWAQEHQYDTIENGFKPNYLARYEELKEIDA